MATLGYAAVYLFPMTEQDESDLLLSGYGVEECNAYGSA